MKYIFFALCLTMILLTSQTSHSLDSYGQRLKAQCERGDSDACRALDAYIRESSRYQNAPSGKGACVYGPRGLKACVNNTYKNECQNNFNGRWYRGKRCP